MAEVLPLPVTRTGESAQELLLEQRDVLVRVENVLERTYSRVELIQDIAAKTLGVQQAQLAMFQRQLENQEFANEEARREAARMRAGGGVGPSGATAETADSGGPGLGALPALATGAIAGGLAASGLRSTLGRLAGRLLRGGGLIALGNIFGETIGNFLGTEAAAILEDLGADPEFANQVGNAIRSNSESAIVGAGISKLLLGRTLPGIVGGIIFNQLDLGRIFTPEGREDLENGIRDWFERLRDGELTNEDIVNGAIVGGAAAYGARRLQRGGEAIGRRFPSFRPDGTVEGPGQAARPGTRPAPTPSGYVRPRRPNGQFMSDAEITAMYEQQIRNARYARVFKNVIRGLGVLGVVLTAAEAYELYNILDSDAEESVKRAAVGAFIGSFVGAVSGGVAGGAVGLYFGPWGALILGALGAGAGGFAGGYIGEYIAGWAFDDEPPRYEIGGIGSQADVNAYLREYGIDPINITPSTPVQGGRGRTVEAPGARALAGQIAGVQTQLEAAQSERAEASNRAARRDANQNVIRLERALEDLEEQLEELNQLFKNSTATLSDASFNSATGGARVYNAALGTGMNTGARTMQAALTPSFGQPRLMRASLSTQGSSTPSEQSFPIPLTGGAEARGSESSLVFQPSFGNALTAMYNDAPEYVQNGLRILSGYRSPDLQARLYEQKLMEVRAAHPDWSDAQIEREARRWVAPPGSSRHNTGQAVDLSYANNRVKQWVHDNAGRYGLHFPLANEDWHIEMAGLGGSRVAMIDTPPVSFANGVPSQTPDRQIAEAPTARTPSPNMPGGDIEAGRSMLGTFSQSIQSLGGFGFDALFGEGAFSQIIGSTNPEQMIANRLDRVFKNVGVSPEAIELNRGSETVTQAAPIVVNAPQINNDNSVQGGGGSGRERASQQVAIAPIGEASATSTMRDWSDAIYS